MRKDDDIKIKIVTMCLPISGATNTIEVYDSDTLRYGLELNRLKEIVLDGEQTDEQL